MKFVLQLRQAGLDFQSSCLKSPKHLGSQDCTTRPKPLGLLEENSAISVLNNGHHITADPPLWWNPVIQKLLSQDAGTNQRQEHLPTRPGLDSHLEEKCSLGHMCAGC